MKLTNDWNDMVDLPQKSGFYHVIVKTRKLDYPVPTQYIVPEDVTILAVDYFDHEEGDFRKFTVDAEDPQYVLKAWKEVSSPLLPYEFNNAILWADVPFEEVPRFKEDFGRSYFESLLAEREREQANVVDASDRFNHEKKT